MQEVMLPMQYFYNPQRPQDEFPAYVLATGEHKGYRYYVVNLNGRHPCAYIRVPRGEFPAGLNSDVLDSYVDVHGGFTYSESSILYAPYSKDWWYIGWDYGHYRDYAGYYQNEPEGSCLRNTKRWTTEEIVAECEACCAELDRLHTKRENNWNV